MGLTHPPGFPIVSAPTRTHARCRSYNAPIFLNLKPTDLSSLYAIVNRLPPLCGPRPLLRPSDQVAHNDFHYQMPTEEQQEDVFKLSTAQVQQFVCLAVNFFQSVDIVTISSLDGRKRAFKLMITLIHVKLTWFINKLNWVYLTADTRHALGLPNCKMTTRHSN